MDAYKSELGARALPEQLFSGSGLCILHEASGVALQFNAVSSLRQWHAAALTALKRLEALVRAAQPAQPAQRAAQVWISLRIRFSPRFDFMEWDLETVGNTCMDASK